MIDTKLAVFKGKTIRRTIHENEWWFSVVDIIQALTEQPDYQAARNYWKVLKNRLINEGSESVTNCNQLKLEASDGKKYLTDVANTEGIFRIIQSIPSPKAEPFKRWLAKVGYERIQEIEDPELATKRKKLPVAMMPKALIRTRKRPSQAVRLQEMPGNSWKSKAVRK
jgi:DNA-damage-inducible protein D